jgi:HEAT repeat protein
MLDQVFKGELDTTAIHCRFVQPQAPLGYSGVPASSYRLLFLKRHNDQYEFANPYHPSMPAVPSPPVRRGEPLQMIAAALADVLRSPNVNSTDKRIVISDLAHTRVPEVKSALRAGLAEPDEVVRLSAAGALLSQEDRIALPMVEQALLKSDPTIPDSVLQMLRVGLETGARNPDAIPSLARLSHSVDPATRRAAVSALRHTRSVDSVPQLVAALSDTDREVRYSAVIGLAEMNHDGAHGPSMDAFFKNENIYIEYWREWAKKR